MLFCCACKKENDETDDTLPDPNYETVELGTQYLSGGYTYNTHVRMTLVTEEIKGPAQVLKELRAPVGSITVEIQNDTDFRAVLGRFDEWECEKWENGAWSVWLSGGVHRDVLYTDSVDPHEHKAFTMGFSNKLTEGVYRLRHKVLMRNDTLVYDESSSFECMVEVYFTVTPNYDE
jgi:hypothetical protein